MSRSAGRFGGRVRLAGVTQLVEFQFSKLVVVGSSPIARSSSTMEETAKVLSVSDDIAHVEIARNSTCGSCKACGIGADGKTMVTDVSNTLHAKAGDLVVLSIADSTITYFAALAYGLPSLALLIGFFLFRQIAVVVRLFGSADLASVAGAVLCTIPALLTVRAASARWRNVSAGRPVGERASPVDMVAIIPREGESEKTCISDK